MFCSERCVLDGFCLAYSNYKIGETSKISFAQLKLVFTAKSFCYGIGTFSVFSGGTAAAYEGSEILSVKVLVGCRLPPTCVSSERHLGMVFRTEISLTRKII